MPTNPGHRNTLIGDYAGEDLTQGVRPQMRVVKTLLLGHGLGEKRLVVVIILL